MNNKRGGFFGKLVLVLILMLASAVAGAYAYRVADGKLAAKDATKTVEAVEVDDYDTVDASTVQDLIDDAKEDLEKAQSREEVYDILTDFKKDVDRIQTKAEKQAEQAVQKASEQTNKFDEDKDDEDDKSGGLFKFSTDDED